MRRSGAEVLLEGLSNAGVEVIFGHPGGAMLPGYDALVGSPIRHILARHEQGAGHMAEGYAQASGRLGVVMATSGPGGTNLVTPLADAYMDSIPLLAVTGQVSSAGLGREAFQEADILSITAAVTKHSIAVADPDAIPDAVAEAVHVATTGRPGPVLIDIPKDVLAAMTAAGPAGSRTRPGRLAPHTGAPAAVGRAAETLRTAVRPVLYVGGGVLKGDAAGELRELVELMDLPVVTTLMGRGAFPDDHPNHLGMPGMHGTWTATSAMQRCDLLVSLGARFDDRVTGKLDGFAPEATVIHVDIDPVEIGKNVTPDVAILGDCKAVLRQLLDVLHSQQRRERDALALWWGELRRWQHDHPLRCEQHTDGPLKPQTVLTALNARLGGGGIVVTGVGQHQMWAAQYLDRAEPRSWITSGGLGTMGFCLPAALGAKVARPREVVVAVDGDGSFQMTSQELATARAEGLAVVLVVLNNGGLGMVRQWQRRFHDGRFSQVDMDPGLPDLVGLAEAHGCIGLRCSDTDSLDATLDKALTVGDRPVLVDVRVDPDEEVYPMVAAGSSNSHILEGPEDFVGSQP